MVEVLNNFAFRTLHTANQDYLAVVLFNAIKRRIKNLLCSKRPLTSVVGAYHSLKMVAEGHHL